MKIGVFGRKLTALFAVLLIPASTCLAQVPGSSGPAGLSSALTRLFGKTTAFSAKGEMEVTDNSNHEVSFWPMDFSILDKKIRVEIDLTQTRTRGVPAQMGAMLKQMGMSQVISIVRPDKGLVYVIYPDQRAVMSMPLPKEDSEATEKTPNIAKTPLGKETVDGHACVKNKVVITDSAGQSTEAITWEASDLREIPIQIETRETGNTSIVRFKQIQFARPAAGFFEPPSGFTMYDTPEALKLSVMKKVVDNASKESTKNK
ncbi:MAG TPA: hypothetical protein VFE51_06785 [Verrucomicrobiae bacterium]|nr:hypothetical protein [Verrucomicrobiae bacterium]